MKKKFFYLGCCLVILLSFRIVSAVENNSKLLRVDVSFFSPFVMETTNGLTGFDIDLWKAVADEAGLEYEFQKVEFKKKLSDLADGLADISIGGITVDAERESFLDFGMPTFNSGLLIMVRKEVKKSQVLPVIFKNLFNLEMAKILFFLFITLILFGTLIWLVEKKGKGVLNDGKGDYGDSIWTSWMITTTIGFGDVFPVTRPGRLLTVPVFFIGVALIGLITGPIVSAFTVRDIELVDSKINGPQDLYGKNVATKEGTISVVVARELGANVAEYPSLNDACDALLNGQLDAVVYDAPGIIHHEKTKSDGAVHVGKMFANQHLAFAFPQGSDLREKVNLALLKIRQDGTYDNIYQKWFGN